MANSIDTKINMIYDFIYSKSYTKNLKEYNIDINKIKIEDFKYQKKLEGSDSNEYNELIDELFKGKFKFVTYDPTTNMIVIKRYGDSFTILLHISPYKSIKAIEELDDMNNNDMIFSYILSPLVLGRITIHILLPIINIDVDFQQMTDIIQPYAEQYMKYMKQIENEEISRYFSIRVKESFFKSIQLKEFLESNKCNIKKLLFQVIHTLAILQKEFPGFRHNMLSPTNIYMYLKKEANSITKYEYDGMVFYIPTNTFEIKITNFNAASIPEQYSSNMLDTSKSPNAGAYYDLHYFLNTIIDLIAPCDDETTEFLDKIIPKKYRNKEVNKELFVPADLLKDKYFNEFTKVLKMEESMAADDYYQSRKHKVKPTIVLEDSNDSVLGNQGRKKIIKGKRSSRRVQEGGAIYKPPYNKYKNSPFISNEARRINKVYAPEEKPQPPPQPTVIASQEISMNPVYQKPRTFKEKPSYENDYEPMAAPSNVPKAKVHYDNPSTYHKPFEKTKPYVPGYGPPPKAKVYYENENTPESPVEEKAVPKAKIHYDEKMSQPAPKKYEESDPHEKMSQPTPKVYEDSRPYEKMSRPYDKMERYDKTDYKQYDKPYKPSDKSTKPYEQSYKPFDKSTKPYDKPYDKPYNKPPEQTEYYRQSRQQNITESPVIAEQKLYANQLTAPNMGVGHTHPKYTNPAWVSVDNQMMYPPAFVPEAPNYFPYAVPLQKPNEIPLQKIYNINLGNPSVRHSALNAIYEDAMPGDPYVYTMATIYERIQVADTMRNSINRKSNDGGEMTLQIGPNSLLEYISMLEFNPYSIGGNPYRNIPPGFLLYSGAYPVRYNTEKGRVEIAKHSLGVNVRIYKGHDGFDTNSLIYNETRELEYYKYITDNIIKRKVCPNFVALLFWRIDKVSRIDYAEVNSIISRHNPDFMDKYKKNDAEIRDNYKAVIAELDTHYKEAYKTRKGADGTPLITDPQTSLLVITEAPTSNIIEWASPIIQKSGAVYTTTSTGFHTTDVWKSVLFQLAFAMAVLQENEIDIDDFSLENNVFVKDLYSNPSNVGYWVYSIDGVEYYVPNYGHLVLIDSRYTGDRVYKIESTKINPSSFGKATIRDNVFDAFQSIFNSNTFIDMTKKYDMLEPRDLDNIFNAVNINSSNSIVSTIINQFPEYLHNRIGTMLERQEKDHITPMTIPQFKKGNLIAYQHRYEEYKWGLYLGPDAVNKHTIFVKDGDIYKEKSMFSYCLMNYPKQYSVQQISDRAYRLSREMMLERYELNTRTQVLEPKV